MKKVRTHIRRLKEAVTSRTINEISIKEMDKANTVVMDPAERNHLGVSFEFNNLSFPSVSNDSFRMTATSSAEGVKLWLESKKTKHQWQACIVKISDCGPAGIPEEVVFSFLQVNLTVF